jgi:hypothetical protein
MWTYDDEGASDVAGGGDYDDADERHQIWHVGPLVVKTVDACVELDIANTLVEKPRTEKEVIFATVIIICA